MKTCPTFFVGGCSGTCVPNSAKNRSQFGVNTTSLGLSVGDVGFFIDNGTGIGNVVNFLNSKVVYGIQTHFHSDHCSGLPMNQLLFKPGGIAKIFAPRLGKKTFADVVEKSFETQTWPVSPAMFKANTEIVNFEPGESLNEIWVKTLLVNHPGGCVAYRFCLPEGDLVIATDCELSEPDSIKAMSAFVSGARLAYFDVQYRDTEYEGIHGIGVKTCGVARRKWGHSTPSMIHKLLEACSGLPNGIPRQILMGHHDPLRDDVDLLICEREAKELLKDFPVNVLFAREGDKYSIG